MLFSYYCSPCILRPPLKVVFKCGGIYIENIKVVSLIGGLKIEGSLKMEWPFRVTVLWTSEPVRRSECYQSLTAHQHQKGHTVPKQVITISTSIQVATVLALHGVRAFAIRPSLSDKT